MTSKVDSPSDPATAPDRMMRETAYERVEALLNAGELRPGQLVSQRELVAMTGTTLGSIREATSRLAAEGLLQALPKRGLLVPSMDAAFVRDAYQLRKILELSAIETAISRIARETVSSWIRRHEEAASRTQQQADALQKLDWEMHAALIASMQNQLVAKVYRVTAIKIRMAVQYRLRLTPFIAERVISEHLAFLTPIYDGDTSRARAGLEQHIDKSLTLALGGTL